MAKVTEAELISNAEVSRLLGTDERTTRKLPLPGRVKVGRVIRYKRRAIERWLDGDDARPSREA